ncbi:sigma-70 family RNA polymerase sigma factor [Brevundimonas sp. G8]|uniref:sigma-70 family RNA polymerase sigma factor n=1 Tax=Brevundimonas sp. G8 TaxID=1350776 RepID=UPI0012F11553|nr:sigma-70 family RNA polymerase sigma factor [Brevundimonas sp. G8]VXB67291.1 ECF RNA polymerase sigma factor SigJ [Brevundimonas sp. G8]
MMPTDPSTATFEQHRPRLLRLAYRMLGSASEADDIVQEAWLRWRRVDPGDIEQPAAWLARAVTRLCLDTLKSARARREAYVGNWLPEPIFEPEDSGPALDDLTLSLMMALERLSPLERAAFLLHDVFGTPLTEVAVTLGRDAAAVRQMAARARRHVRDARPRYPVTRDEGDRIARAFYAASNQGDLAGLRSLLADAVVLTADGGGKSTAWRRPIVGLDHVVRLFEGLHRKLTHEPSVLVDWAWIDGLPGYVSYERDGALQTTALEIEDGRILSIFITRNPDKLIAATGLAASRSVFH